MTVQEILQELAIAWTDRDPEAVAGLFAEDAVYAASVGPDPGRRAQGRAAIRRLVGAMFALDEGAVAETSTPVVFGDCAFWTWKYTLPDGSVELGCDFLRVHDGRIVLKDAYRKIQRDEEN